MDVDLAAAEQAYYPPWNHRSATDAPVSSPRCEGFGSVDAEARATRAFCEEIVHEIVVLSFIEVCTTSAHACTGQCITFRLQAGVDNVHITCFIGFFDPSPAAA